MKEINPYDYPLLYYILVEAGAKKNPAEKDAKEQVIREAQSWLVGGKQYIPQDTLETLIEKTGKLKQKEPVVKIVESLKAEKTAPCGIC